MNDFDRSYADVHPIRVAVGVLLPLVVRRVVRAREHWAGRVIDARFVGHQRRHLIDVRHDVLAHLGGRHVWHRSADRIAVALDQHDHRRFR